MHQVRFEAFEMNIWSESWDIEFRRIVINVVVYVTMVADAPAKIQTGEIAKKRVGLLDNVILIICEWWVDRWLGLEPEWALALGRNNKAIKAFAELVIGKQAKLSRLSLLALIKFSLRRIDSQRSRGQA